MSQSGTPSQQQRQRRKGELRAMSATGGVHTVRGEELMLDIEGTSALPASPYLSLGREVRMYTRAARGEVDDAKKRLQRNLGQELRPQDLATVIEDDTRRLARTAGQQFVWDQVWDVLANEGDLESLETWLVVFATADSYSLAFMLGGRSACRKAHRLLQAHRRAGEQAT